MIYRSKKALQRRSKHTICTIDPLAFNHFYKAVDAFRRRKRRSPFIKITPYQDYINKESKPNRKKDFKEFIANLEALRCSVGMTEDIFYHLVAEFILQPNEQFYYNPSHLFGCVGSFTADEFMKRVFETLPQISKVVGEDDRIDEITSFITSVNQLRLKVDVTNAIQYKTKDWYCVKAIQRIIKDRGWTEEEFLNKLRTFYRRRVRKVYPEMLLMDVVHGELDIMKEDKPKHKKPPQIRAIENEEWFETWKQDNLT